MLSVSSEAVASCCILNVNLQLGPLGCPAESCVHWIGMKESPDLSCHEGLKSRVRNDGRRHGPNPVLGRGGRQLAGDTENATP